MLRARLARSAAAASSAGFDLVDLLLADDAIEDRRAEQQLLDGALPLDRIHRARPRAADPADSVGDWTPIAAFDRYFFGHTATSAAPAAMASTQRHDEPPLAAVDDRQVIERVKRLWLHHRILMGSETTNCSAADMPADLAAGDAVVLRGERVVALDAEPLLDRVAERRC